MNASPKFCRYCGATLDPNASFCPACGRQIAQPAASPTPPTVNIPEQNNYPVPPTVNISAPPAYPDVSPPLTPPDYTAAQPGASGPPAKSGPGNVILISVSVLVFLALCCCVLIIFVPFIYFKNNNPLDFLIPAELSTLIPGLETMVPTDIENLVPGMGTLMPTGMENLLPQMETLIPTNIETLIPPMETLIPTDIATLFSPVETLIPPEISTLFPTDLGFPNEAPQTTPVPNSAPLVDVNFNNLRLAFHRSLAQRATTEILPAQSGADVPPWEVGPQANRITLEGYVLPDTFHDPTITVYPAAEYAALSPDARQQMDALRSLLAQQPASVAGKLPFLPPWNAGQLMHARLGYLSFKNGSGVRYLTQYAQDTSPINGYDMFYTFQGLTGDGKYYISIILPVSNPVLPARDAAAQNPLFTSNYTGYLQEVQNQLEAQPPASFAPDLSLLDGLVQSVEIR